MFRPLRRIKNAISDDAAKKLLENEKRGIFAVNGDDGYPFALPVNYYYDKEANKIYFHGAKTGHKIDALKKSDKVCFTVFGNERYEEGDWAAYVQSTIVFGRCTLVDSAEETLEYVKKLALRYYPSEKEVDDEIARDISRVQLYVIAIEHISGKQVQER